MGPNPLAPARKALWMGNKMATASGKPKTAGTAAEDASLEARFSALRGRVKGVGDQFAEAIQQLSSLDADLGNWVESLQQREAASGLLASELAQRESQIAARIAEAEAQVAQAAVQLAQVEKARSDFEQTRLRIESESAQLKARAAEIEAAQAVLEQNRAELEAETARLNEERDALGQLQSGLESRENGLTEQLAAIEARETELKSAVAALELRESAVGDREQSLMVREEAIARFQNAFSGMAALFGSKSGLKSGDADLNALAALAGMASEESAENGARNDMSAATESTAVGSEPVTQGPRPTGRAAAAPTKPARQDAAVAGPAEAQPAPAPQADVAAAPAVKVIPQGPASANGAVDESALDADELEKLRVLRRLTGGRKSDAELLDRIRGERGSRDSSGARGHNDPKSKKRWWN